MKTLIKNIVRVNLILVFALNSNIASINAQGKGNAAKAKDNKEVKMAEKDARKAEKRLEKEKHKTNETAETKKSAVKEKSKSNNAKAKEKSVKNKDVKANEKANDKANDKAKSSIAQKEEKPKKGKANAYGKNKGELEGKDFGKVRAEEAKLKRDKKKAELDSKVKKNDQKVKEAKDKIKLAKDRTEKAKEKGELTEKEYKEKMAKINAAEKATKELELELKKAKNQ